MGWLSDAEGAMYYVEDNVPDTWAGQQQAAQNAVAGATSNYFDASANSGEGGQVYVFNDGSTVTTNNIGLPTSATLPTSQYQGTGGATSSEFRPVEGSPTSTNVGGFQVGIETPTLIGQNNQISYDEYGQPNTLRVQPELSNFDKGMRAATIALAVAPWAYGAATGFSGATSGGGYVTPELMGPTYGELGYTGLEAGQMGPTYGELGYTGLNQSQAIAAADAAALANATGSTLSASQLANLLKAGASATKGLTGSSGGTSGINPSLLSSLGQLAQGQTGYGMEVPGIVRTNTNPFYNTPQVALQTPQKTEMSTLSDLLRQGKSSWQT